MYRSTLSDIPTPRHIDAPRAVFRYSFVLPGLRRGWESPLDALRRCIAEADYDAEHARLCGDTTRSTLKANEAFVLRRALGRLEKRASVVETTATEVT